LDHEKEGEMKSLTLTGFLSILALGFAIWAAAPDASAETYLGEFCWQGQGDGETGTLRLAVTDVGGGHFLLNGRMTNSSTPATGAIHGNAEVVGNNVLMTLNESHIDQFATSMTTCSAVLSPSSLGGTIKCIGQDFNYSMAAFEPLNHAVGTINFTPQCP
jgi:hypothetical protein